MSSSAYVNKQALKLEGLSRDNASLVDQALNRYEGILLAQVKLEKSVIRLKYDVQLTNLEEILDLLAEFNVVKGDTSLWWKWRWGIAYQIERNINDNLAHIPHCCGKPPTSARRR